MTAVEFDALVRPNGYQVAQACARVGWRVLPWEIKGRLKKPAITGWPTAATTDLDVIADWWQHRPRCLAGLATGEGSNLVVLDVDRHGGPDGFAALAEVETRHGALTGWPVTTPSGGRHVYFGYPSGRAVRSRNLSRTHGLELKSNGCYVAAPCTSNAIGVYEPRTLEIRLPLPPPPDWLLDWFEERHAPARGRGDDGAAVRSVQRFNVDAFIAAAGTVRTGQEPYLVAGINDMCRARYAPDDLRRVAIRAMRRFVDTDPGNPWSEEQVHYRVNRHLAWWSGDGQ